MPKRLAICRDCGARGIEDETDPAPGLCPQCFDRRMATAIARLRPEMSLFEQYALLRETGLTEQAAHAFLLSCGLSIDPGRADELA